MHTSPPAVVTPATAPIRARATSTRIFECDPGTHSRRWLTRAGWLDNWKQRFGSKPLPVDLLRAPTRGFVCRRCGVLGLDRTDVIG